MLSCRIPNRSQIQPKLQTRDPRHKTLNPASRDVEAPGPHRSGHAEGQDCRAMRPCCLGRLQSCHATRDFGSPRVRPHEIRVTSVRGNGINSSCDVNHRAFLVPVPKPGPPNLVVSAGTVASPQSQKPYYTHHPPELIGPYST